MKVSNRSLVIVSIVVTTVVFELLLRLFGYHPGMFRKLSGFKPVDELVIYENYNTDQMGIYSFSSVVTDSLKRHFDREKGKTVSKAIKEKLYDVDRVPEVLSAFNELYTQQHATIHLTSSIKRKLKNENWDSEFVELYASLIQANSVDDGWTKAVLDYVQWPFNKAGFRSIEFNREVQDRPKVLLVGDSFLYGLYASPFFNSFADILLARGYAVYNAGIAGTDPAQYSAIVAKYLHIIQPDLVIICFYPGNDFMPFYRNPSANEPHEHITNAGFFMSNPAGKYLNPQEAYLHYLAQISIPKHLTFFNRLCSFTSISSLFWASLWKLGLVQGPADQPSADFSKEAVITAHYLNKIAQSCKEYSTTYMIAEVPDIFGIHNNDNVVAAYPIPDSLQFLFDQHDWHFPSNFTENDFASGDNHFNNSGSLKFANFLEQLILSNVAGARPIK
jgi:hypothetical protein